MGKGIKRESFGGRGRWQRHVGESDLGHFDEGRLGQHLLRVDTAFCEGNLGHSYGLLFDDLLCDNWSINCQRRHVSDATWFIFGQ